MMGQTITDRLIDVNCMLDSRGVATGVPKGARHPQACQTPSSAPQVL